MDSTEQYETSRVDDAALLRLHGWTLITTTNNGGRVIFTFKREMTSSVTVEEVIRKRTINGSPITVEVHEFIKQQQILRRQIRELLGEGHGY